MTYDRYKGKFSTCEYYLAPCLVSAICTPFSALESKKNRIVLTLIGIWFFSIALSLPESFALNAVPFLNDR